MSFVFIEQDLKNVSDIDIAHLNQLNTYIYITIV